MAILAALPAVSISPTAAFAEGRKATDGEMRALLQGCWYRTSEHLPGELICFERGGRFTERISTSGEGGLTYTGSYRVAGGRLRFNRMIGDGPVTCKGPMDCDVLLRPEVSLRLLGCYRPVGGEPIHESPHFTTLAQFSYLRLAADEVAR